MIFTIGTILAVISYLCWCIVDDEGEPDWRGYCCFFGFMAGAGGMLASLLMLAWRWMP